MLLVCSGLDGAGVFDTFDARSLDARLWTSLDGDWVFEPAPAYEDGSLRLAAQSTLEGAEIDLSACASVGWRYEVLRPSLGPDVGEFLRLSWWDGATWTVVDKIEGGMSDAAFVQRGGQIDDPAALSFEFRIRFVLDASSSLDQVYLDDVHIDCL